VRRDLHSFPTRRSSDLVLDAVEQAGILDDTRGMLAVQSYLECSDDVDSFEGLAEVTVESLKCAAG